MIIAVTHENGQIFQHFGHSTEIKFYLCDGQKILESKVVNTEGQGHGALAYFLQAYNTDVLICGGIGPGAQMGVMSMGILLFAGVSGNCDEAVQALLNGTLEQNSEANCNCHHHHEEGHEGCGCHHHHEEQHEECGCHEESTEQHGCGCGCHNN